MSTYNANSSGRRSGRGQRRNRDRGDDYRPNSQSDRRPDHRSEPAPAPARKLSFWEKIVGFFKSKPAPTTGAAARPQQPRGGASVTSNYPDAPAGRREERAPREQREARPVDSRPPRKPEAVEVTSPKLYIGNLSFDATESDLSELFGGVGAVQSAEIVTHKQTEKSKGFAFVTMTSVDEAKRAVEVLHDKDFMGRKLVVSGAKTPTER